MGRRLLSILLIVSSTCAEAGELEDVLACINAAEFHGGIQLDIAKANYQSKFFARCTADWPNAHCEVDAGKVYNLRVNNKDIIIDEFIGREAFELHKRLESEIANAVTALEVKIGNLRARQAYVKQSLRKADANHEALISYVQDGIAEALNKPRTDPPDSLPSQGEKTSDQADISTKTDASIITPTRPSKKAWVTADSLNSRTCPAANCGVVALLNYRHEVTVSDESGGWARITDYVDAQCKDGRTPLVTKGNDRCLEGNGIKDGLVATWVSAKHLAYKKPPGWREKKEQEARENRQHMGGEFRTMTECLQAIERSSGQRLRVVTDRPDNVSGLLSNNEMFSCTRESTGTKGVYYEGYYSRK